MSLDDVVAKAVRDALAIELPRALKAVQASARDPDEPLAVGVATAARLLDQPEETIREWIRDGTLKASRPAGKRAYLVPMAELRKLILTGPAANQEAPATNTQAQAAAVLSTLPRKAK